MAIHAPVPSETEPTSLVDLVEDCRQVEGVLGHAVIDLTPSGVEVPPARVPLDRLPASFGALPVKITDDLLVTVDGMDDY